MLMGSTGSLPVALGNLWVGRCLSAKKENPELSQQGHIGVVAALDASHPFLTDPYEGSSSAGVDLSTVSEYRTWMNVEKDSYAAQCLG